MSMKLYSNLLIQTKLQKMTATISYSKTLFVCVCNKTLIHYNKRKCIATHGFRIICYKRPNLFLTFPHKEVYFFIPTQMVWNITPMCIGPKAVIKMLVLVWKVCLVCLWSNGYQPLAHFHSLPMLFNERSVFSNIDKYIAI